MREGGSDDGQNAHLPTFVGRVLVVEDEEVNRIVARGILAFLGIEPDFAEGGGEALEKVAAHHYDLIFMDIQMPTIDGLKTTALIREHERAGGQERTPIVALTAYAVKGDRERCLNAGMDGYISKPLMRGELMDVLERWLGGKDGQGQSVQQQVHDQEDADGPLDSARLDELATSMRAVPGGLRDVLESYLESLARLPAAILEAREQGDAETLTRAAHSLKSNSATAGALKLSTLAENLEVKVATSGTMGVEALVLGIENEIGRVIVAIEKELDETPR